jgi:outer membrane lipoprotein-sorting protein
MDFEGRAKIAIQTSKVKHDLKAALLFRRPDMLKMELAGFMGMSLATMAVRDSAFQIYLPMLNRVLEGRVDGRRFQELTGVPFDLHDLRSILLGTSMWEALGDSTTTLVDTHQGRYLLSNGQEDRLWNVWVDAVSLMPVEEEMRTTEGTVLMRKVYGNYVEDDGVEIPLHVHIIRGDEEVDIRFTAYDTNSDLPMERFEMKVPEEAVRVSL